MRCAAAVPVVHYKHRATHSRWLPTLLARVYNKLLINIALGFDTFLVMRHGTTDSSAPVPPSPPAPPSTGAGAAAIATAVPGLLGCYFCNDVVAPANSTHDRTLDQQCTVGSHHRCVIPAGHTLAPHQVTRPGLAPMASAMGVELLVSLLHHPLGGAAPAESAVDVSVRLDRALGLVPHQVRMFLAHFAPVLVSVLRSTLRSTLSPRALHTPRAAQVAANAFDKCTACSSGITAAYVSRGFDFLMDVFNTPGHLESVSGLDALQAAAEEAMLEWNDEEDEDW